MSTTAAPYGLIPIKKIGGQPYTGSFTQHPLAANYATSIFAGDVMKRVQSGGSGYVAKDTGTTTATPIGVFIGVSYTDANMGKVFKNTWVASTVASDAMAYIVDDPDVIFKIQGDGAGTIYGLPSLGTNAALVQGSGNSTTGVSAVSLDSSTVANTGTLPVKIIGYDPLVGNAIGDTYVDFWVIFNTHAYRTATGTAPT